jgi:DNA polymerase III psi subunit
MNRNFAYSFILLLASSHTHALNEGLFIEKILQSAHLFENAAINLEIKEIELLGDERQYNNWHWDLDGEVLLSGRLQNKDTNYTYTHQQIKSDQLLSTELSKRFFSNGSELTLSLSGSLPKTSEEKYKNQSYYSDVVTSTTLVDAEINWQLPLLRNAGGALDQRTYDLAVLDLEDEQWVFRRFQEDIVASYLKSYFEYAILGDNLRLLQMHISQLDLLVAYIRDGALDEKLVSSVEQAASKAKSRLMASKGETHALTNKLKSVLSTGELEAIELIFYHLKMNPFGDIEAESVDLKRIRIEQLKNQRQIRYYQNTLKPELDFAFNASRAVQKGNYSSYSESDTTDVEISLSFEYPLSGDVGAKTLLRKYQLKARQLEIKYNSKLKDLKTKQKELQLGLQTGLEGIDFINNQLSRLDVAAIDFKGLLAVEVRPYIERLTDVLELKLDYNDELIEYHHARVDYDNLLSHLLVKSL